MKIAFLGTPEFAVPSLLALIRNNHVLCVFTQPDKPQGRKAILTPPPVKVAALEYGIPVFQPAKIREAEGINALKDFNPELMVTAAFGQILSAENLSVPKHGCINVHGSLLPKYRGAAPIQTAIINGEKQTGITTMQTDVGLDTGDILLSEKLDILPDETAGELYTRMAELGAKVLIDTISLMEKGALIRIPQDNEQATKCSMLKKEDGKLDFTQNAQSIHDRIRGVNPWPGAYTFSRGDSLKIWRSRISDMPLPDNSVPGLCFTKANSVFVCCADMPVELVELQSPGGKRMDAAAFLRGNDLNGSRFC